MAPSFKKTKGKEYPPGDVKVTVSKATEVEAPRHFSSLYRFKVLNVLQQTPYQAVN